MNFAVFGLSISSSWGNGHASLLRGLFRELHAAGHQIHFFERDVAYYAQHRDSDRFAHTTLHLYREWSDIAPLAARILSMSDVGMITSYCPDGIAASHAVLNHRHLASVYYDMDTPVTLSRLSRGEQVEYLPPEGLGGFDLVLSYTGGQSLSDLKKTLGCRRVEPFYGWVDPTAYFPTRSDPRYQADLSYLGTFAQDRQAAFEQLLLKPAISLPTLRFVVGGAMYIDAAQWPANVTLHEHVAPPDHASFYSSSLLTLNLTRASMAQTGWCPSGRLFEAAACGTAVISDLWSGLDTFFTPESEILIAHDSSEITAALQLDSGHLKEVGSRARARVLDCHTAALRASQLKRLIEGSSKPMQEPVAQQSIPATVLPR